MRLHHVQLACPSGGEDGARRFWVDGMGLSEVPKPDTLAGRGGAWFRAYDDHGGVTFEVHVGVDSPFHPAAKAHPALLLDIPEQLDALAQRLDQRGFDVDTSQRDTFPGHRRFHCFDAHGNRVEVLAALSRR